MTAYVIDTETTGTEPPEVIELAIRHFEDRELPIVERFRPAGPITWGAVATHHILPQDLAECRPSSEARLPGDTQYIIGHNVDYDWQALGCPNVKRICTLAIARTLHPNVDSHSLVAMYYYYMGMNHEARQVAVNAHGAAADVRMCWAILRYMTKGLDDLEALWRYSEACRIPQIIPFGKHKGTAISDLPWDYRKWMLRQDDMDPYVLEAVRRTMK